MNCSSKLRAIQTPYNGVPFRSRLEARWAVFFDNLGIDWEYEPEGYLLRDCTRYVPDFWLPTFNGGMFVEVKPLGDPFIKAKKFACESPYGVWFAEGYPALKCQRYSGFLQFIEDDLLPDWDALNCDWGLPNFADAEFENRMFYQASWDGTGTDIFGEGWEELFQDSRLAKAAIAATKYRFDWRRQSHGKT